MKSVVLLATYLLSISFTTAAAGRDYVSRNVSGWTVAESKDGKGCFLSRKYDHAGETTLLLGLDIDGTNHLSVLNANWSIEARDRLKLTFRLSNGAYPAHFAVGIAADGKQGFVSTFESKFPAYFAGSRTLSISRGNVPVERLALDGSGVAVAALRGCVAERMSRLRQPAKKNQAGSIPLDPFAPRRGGK